MRVVFAVLAALATVLAWAAPAAAHGVRSGALRIDEVAPGRAIARFTTPVAAPGVAPVFPPECAVTTDAELSATTLDCSGREGGLAGADIGVRGLGPILSEATRLVRFADGREAARLLTPASPAWALPRASSAAVVARSYVRSGLVHIATGFDHLLFLGLLVLVLRRLRAVVLAETAFTLSHSLAFAATSLGWIRVRPAPVEACIALSLVLLALDVRREPSPRPVWHGAALALVFGLVHGLGFAGGLREAGLPDTHVAVALVGFGAGVEIGQVAFLVVVWAAVAAAARLRAFPRVVDGAAVLSGGVATAWLVERVFG